MSTSSSGARRAPKSSGTSRSDPRRTRRLEYPELTLRTRAAWRRWLAKHHASSRGVWFVHFKLASGKLGVAYGDCVEEALCFGWIDSTVRTLDAERYAHLLTPRTDPGNWSPLNRRRMERLQVTGAMTPAGLAVYRPVAAARPNPRSDLNPPDSLQRALKRHPAARRNFEALAPGYRRQYVTWLVSAKREDTRARRLTAALSLLAAGRKLGMK